MRTIEFPLYLRLYLNPNSSAVRNVLKVVLLRFSSIPSVAVWREHHAAALRDVDDAVLGVDGHPAQLDVL